MAKIKYTRATAAAAATAFVVAGGVTVLANPAASQAAPGDLPQAHVTGMKVPGNRVAISSTARRELADAGIPAGRTSPVGTITGNTDTYRHLQWGFDAINAPAANATATGSGVTVAVVDTGVAKVTELAGKVLPGKDFIATGDGTADGHGHGTAIASIIAAIPNNGIGLAGIAPDVKILPVRVCDADGGCPMDAVAAGIVFAADAGAQVINASLGGGRTAALDAAIAYAEGKGAVVVASAGNSAEKGNPVLYPGGYDTAVGVGAVDSSRNRAAFSEYGPQIDIAAPGVSIVQATTSNSYALGSGTSQAAPHVSAAAALAKGYRSTLTPAQMRDLITATATDLGPAGRDDHFGAGLVDAAKMLTDLGANPTPPTGNPSPPTPAPTTVPVVSRIAPLTGSTAGGTVVTITGTNLASATGVKFGDVAATSFSIVSATQITAVTPAGTGGGAVVKVVNAAGTSASTTVKYTYRSPLGAEFTDKIPARTTGGTIIPVTVTGGTVGASAAAFAAEKVTAKVGETAATVTWAGPNNVKVTAPATTKATAVTIQLFHDGVPGPVSAAKVGYTPTVTAVAPAKVLATGGATVTITGTGFLGVDATDPSAVTVGGVNVTSYTVKSATQIIAVVPAGTDGTAPVTVRTSGGASADIAAARITYRATLGLSVPDGTVVKATGGPILLDVTGGTVGADAKQFTAQRITVTAGTTRLTPVWVGPTRIRVTLPASKGASVILTIVNDGFTGGSTTVTYAPVVK
jgi:subtilisin family serine protease